jgi:hypothetical protein
VVMVLWRTVSLLSGPAPAGDSASRQEALIFFSLNSGRPTQNQSCCTFKVTSTTRVYYFLCRTLDLFDKYCLICTQGDNRYFGGSKYSFNVLVQQGASTPLTPVVERLDNPWGNENKVKSNPKVKGD